MSATQANADPPVQDVHSSSSPAVENGVTASDSPKLEKSVKVASDSPAQEAVISEDKPQTDVQDAKPTQPSTASAARPGTPSSEQEGTKKGSKDSSKSSSTPTSLEDMVEASPKPIKKSFFDTTDYVTFWSHIEAGFIREAKPTKLFSYLEHGQSTMEKAFLGELPDEHLDYLEKTALRSVIIAVVARPTPWPLELKPGANQFLHLAAQFILQRLDSPNVNHLTQSLHRIFLNNHEHCPFYVRQSKEELPEDLQRQYLPNGIVNTGNSLSEIDTTNMTPEEMIVAWKKATNWVRINSRERVTSPLYFVNVNFFGANQGFSRIVDLIESSKNMSLFTLKLCVKVLCAMRFGLSLAFLKVFLPSFVDIVCKKLLEWFGVTLKPDLRTHYNDTIDFLILMLNEIMPEEQAIQRMDTYTLDGCLMLFNTENLEKRLRGLRDIKALVDRTAKSEEKRFAAIGKFFTGQSPQEEEEEKKKKRQPRIPPKVIMGWLEQHSFMDLFFQMLKSHIEILRQGTPILIFVAQQGKLSLKHLDNIWSMAATMHEHDKRILNTSLVALVPHLPPSHLDHLITQISGSPIQSIDEQVVDLIVSLTTLSVAADTHHKWSGLQLLWELCQDPVHPTDASAVSSSAGHQAVAGSTAESDANDVESGSAPALLASASSTPKKRSKKPAGDLSSSTSAVPASTSIDPLLAHKAFTKLCDLLTTEECTPQRPTYMERCFTNLEEHRSVSLSIEIMRRCIDAYPARRRKKAVTDLESKKKLITLIFDDFQFYKNEAARLAKIQESAPVVIVAPTAVSAATLAPPAAGKKQRRKSNATEELVANAAAATTSRPATPSTLASSAGNIPAAFDVNTMNVLGRGHLDNVNQRLFFLEYVISNAALTMRMEQLDLLWDLFITQALSAAEREAAFGWLERASTSSGDVVILSEVQLQHLFTEKMLTMQATAVTTAGYHLFERYFCRINDRQGKVKYAEERNDKSIGLVSPDAVGLDKLWEIALENEDKAVSAAAISTLNQLHLNLELFMNRAKAIKIRETYVQHALSKLAQPGAQAPAGSLERCLRLLMECVEDYEELKGESAVASGPGTANAGLLSGWTFGDVFGGKRGKNAGATTVKVFLKSAGKSPQRLVLNSQTTIRSIAEKATELFNFDIYDTLKLTVEDEKDKELKELDKTLGDYKVADDSTIVVRKTMESIEGTNAEGSSVFAAFLAGLPLGIGGVGATTDQIRVLVARAETALKQGAANANSAGKTVAKLGSDSSSEPMFPPIIRASVPREIRLADDKARELHPARILCSPNHFGPLYDLLGTTDENLGEVLWELLTMLPKSDQKIVEITRMKDNEGVVKHFPHQKPFQMLYNLQLLENLLTKAMNPEPVIPVTTAATNPGLAGAAILDKVWISTLLSSGLLEHLLDKFFSIKISTIRKSTATVKLLPQLLRIINMLALEVSESSSIASHLSSLNLSRSTHSHRSPAGKYRLATQREHFKTTSSTSHEEFVSDFVSKILRLSTSLASGPPQPSTLTSAALAQVMEDDALIVQEALTILIPLVTSSPSTLERFLGDESFATWLLDLTLKSPNLATRECAVRAISELVSYTSSANSKVAVAPAASKSRPISLVLFEILLPFLVDDSLDQYASSCDEFFLTFEILLRDVAATPYYGDSKKKGKSEGDSKSPTAHPVLLELLKSLISKIETRPVVEKFALAGNEDKILIGLMQLVFSIVYRDGAAVAGEKTRNALYKPSCRSLVKEIFHVCLFAIPTEELRGPDAPPKCKTKASRAIAYKLLTELCSHCDRNLNTVLKLLQEQVQSIDMGGDYTYYTGRNEKSTTGYVGLQNQGATCYMNATMQQLYMVNEFRQGILSTVDQSFATPIESVLKLPPEKKKKKKVSPYYNDESDDNSSEEAAAIEWDDSTALVKLQKESVLYQLQRMFAHLQEGERRSFDTRQFCHSYKDLEGQPINTSQQMDANEYFNRLFECLEAKLAGGPQARILEQVFGGKYANQLLGTGSECSHRRESTEPFSSISVDIKHKTTLQDSLKSFCEGEVLSGDNKFQCSHCSKPVDTLKRCLIHSLPGILAIHLKRFEFDYVQMRHYKLNSSCSFPVELDMEPYMRESHAAKENAKSKAGEQGEGDNDKPSAESSNDENTESLTDLINLAQARKAAGYYDYELVGVVVHVGSSDAGHYYSFIKERPDSLPPGRVRDSTVGTKWFEFNDSYVTEFDPNKIPVECFGGEDEVMEFTDETRTTKRAVKRPRTNNAYILFYQRKGWNGSSTGENAEASVNVKNGASSSTGTHSRNPSTGTALVAATAQENGTMNDEVEELNEKSLTASRPGGGRPKVVSEDGSGDSSPNTDEPSSAEDHSASEPTTSSKANHVDGESSTAPTVHVNGSHPDSSTTSPAATASPSNEDSVSSTTTTKASGDALSAAPDKPKITIDTAGSGGPIDIFKSIYEENRLFILRKHLFDSEYFNFVWSIVNANLPPIPTRSQDEIRREKEDAQRKSDANRMYRERRELERETNAFPSPFVPRMGMMQNMPAPPGPRQITIGSGANAIKIEVRAINSTPSSVKQEDARRAKERKEEEKRKAKEKPLDADEQRLEQDKKMDAAEKAAKDKKTADKKAAAEKKATSGSTTKKKGDAAEDGDGSKQEGDEKKKKTKKDSSAADTAEEDVSSSSGTSSVKADLTTFALDFIKNIYVHARETPLLSLWLTTLYRLYAANLNKARALLKGLIEDPSEMAHLLMNLTSEKARNCHAQMIVAAMRALAPKERSAYLSTALQLTRAAKAAQSGLAPPKEQKEPASYCVWFIEELWKLQKTARRNHFDSFYYIFAQFASFGPLERQYFMKRSYIMDVVSFALFFEPAAQHSRCLNTPRQAATEMFHLADFVSTLLLSCDAESPNTEDQPPSSLNPDTPYELTAKEHPYVLGYLFNNLLMREDVNAHAVGRIFCHFAWENKEMSDYLLNNISKGIIESSLPSQTRGYMDVLCYIVKNLDDSLQPQRLDAIIQAFVKWIQRYKNTRRSGSERVIQSFFIMASLNTTFRNKVMQAKSSLNIELDAAGYRIM